MRIALLEDDPDQAKLMELWLMDAGHRIIEYKNGHDFIKGIINESFDALILDWMVPGMDGLEVLDWVRENIEWPVPILFITQRDTEKDVVTALEHGADDYMAKPVKRLEMLARIGAISRRVVNTDEADTVVEFKPYLVNRSRRRVEIGDLAIELTDKEYELVWFLFRNSGRVLSRGHILESVWGTSAKINTRTVDTHISRIRKKLNLTPESGWRLTSIYQHGYRLERLEALASTTQTTFGLRTK